MSDFLMRMKIYVRISNFDKSRKAIMVVMPAIS